jgi:hypothetical protein
VVAQDTPFGLADNQVKTLSRIGAVADDVPEAVNGFYAPAFDVRENRRQRLDIRMYVAYYRKHS